VCIFFSAAASRCPQKRSLGAESASGVQLPSRNMRLIAVLIVGPSSAPGGKGMMAKEILCGFGIDVDAVAGWLGSYGGEDSPDDISRGLFAGEVGSPRLLRLFGRLGIKTTWFIPGHSIETFPARNALPGDTRVRAREGELAGERSPASSTPRSTDRVGPYGENPGAWRRGREKFRAASETANHFQNLPQSPTQPTGTQKLTRDQPSPGCTIIS
jgi:hypothetical protein